MSLGAEEMATARQMAVADTAAPIEVEGGNNNPVKIPMTAIGLPYMTAAATAPAATGAMARRATLDPARSWKRTRAAAMADRFMAR